MFKSETIVTVSQKQIEEAIVRLLQADAVKLSTVLMNEGQVSVTFKGNVPNLKAVVVVKGDLSASAGVPQDEPSDE